MCNNDLTNIFLVDFSQTTDEINWFSSSSNPVSTISNKLVIIPDAINNIFARSVGIIDIAKNRINVKLNLEIFRPTTGGFDTSEFLIQVLSGSNVIGKNTVHINNIGTSETVKYFFDRLYKYDNLSGNISLKIKNLQGTGNELRLINLSVDNYFYCQENVRTYFVFDEFLENSLTSQSSALKLNSFKVDNIETLTPAFHNFNGVNLGGAVSNWNYAKSNIDGTNRTQENTQPITFNPFVNEFGLVFDTVNSFHGGKPISTNGNQDFGQGILNFGFDKPVILNGSLQEKKGCFFIDIDYTKNLYIEIDILVNNTSSSVYNFPAIYRRYYIIWNKDTCEKQFYYVDKNLKLETIIDQLVNGFLSGITPEVKETTAVGCNQTVNYSGASGVFEYVIDFGTQTGMCGINYNAYGVPDRFEILWDSIHVDTKYVGLSSYNQQLINNGVNPSDINTTQAGNGTGQLMFFKSTPTPTTAIVKVSAVLPDTGWAYSGICPQAVNIVSIDWPDTHTTETRYSISNLNELIELHVENISFANETLQTATWQRETGIGWVDITPYNLNPGTVTAYSGFLNRYRLKAVGSLGTIIYSNVLEYEITSIDTGGGGTGGGCPTLDMSLNVSETEFKKVSDLQVADFVYTKHEKTKEFGNYQIESITYSKQKIMKFVFENNLELKVSTSHKFETPTGEYVNALSFNEGESISYYNLSLKIKQIELLKEEQTVAHIEVNDAHTYMINGVNSHNKLLPPDENDPLNP